VKLELRADDEQRLEMRQGWIDVIPIPSRKIFPCFRIGARFVWKGKMAQRALVGVPAAPWPPGKALASSNQEDQTGFEHPTLADTGCDTMIGRRR